MNDEWKPNTLKPNVVCDKSYAFALQIIELARLLRKQGDYELASQVLRAGTSIGANIEEAQSGVSRADFAAKIGIASKEARETHYWLRLIRDARLLPHDEVAPRIHEVSELLRLLTAIVRRVQVRTQKLNIENSSLKIRKVPHV
ncbi:MAG: four helix bundle protein [Nitrospira sp.]|nr:four helix bundle protein [Nitrospira sp.]